MEYNLEVYQRWAPHQAMWTQWAKPVIFSTFPRQSNTPFRSAKVSWIENLNRKMMIILDLEGEQGVQEALAYAKIGYRPVPLYNGVKAQMNVESLVNVDTLQSQLFVASLDLEKCIIANDAPPVFMLDSRRMESSRQPGVFDNRWSIFPQDMPSGSFLKHNGIERIVVRAGKIQDDLSHILYRYQKEGLDVYLCKEKDDSPTKVTVRRPSRFKGLRYRFLVMMGLRRNSTGGFGSMVPDVNQHYSGVGYRGIG